MICFDLTQNFVFGVTVSGVFINQKRSRQMYLKQKYFMLGLAYYCILVISFPLFIDSFSFVNGLGR